MGKSSGRTFIIDLVDAKIPDKQAYKLMQVQSGSGQGNRWIRFVSFIPQAVTFPSVVLPYKFFSLKSINLNSNNNSILPTLKYNFFGL